MSDTAHRYYRPSSAAPISGIITMFTVGSLAAAVLAVIYGLVAYFNPFIYFTFIAAAFFGAGVGMAIQYGTRIGRVRNRKVVIGVSFVIAAVAVYLCWVAYVSLVIQMNANAEDKAAIGLVVTNPVAVAALIQFFAENPLWEMRGSKPSASGLYTIWALEALIIGGIALLTGMGDCIPFCESCNRWTEPEELAAKVPLESAADFSQALEEEQYSKLLSLRSGTVNPLDCVHLTAYACPLCEETDHLTAVRKTITTNDKGEEETKERTVFENMIVPHSVVQGLATLPAETPAEEVVLSSEETAHSKADADVEEPPIV